MESLETILEDSRLAPGAAGGAPTSARTQLRLGATAGGGGTNAAQGATSSQQLRRMEPQLR